MKRSRYSPSSASMFCSSPFVPSVATTSACVSPRVNSAEPCVRGSTPVRISIGRTVRVSRPSMRGSPFRICAADDLRFDVEQDVADGRSCRRASGPRPAPVRRAWRSSRRRLPSASSNAACLLRSLVSGAQFGLREFGHACDQRFVLRRRLPVPFRLAAFAHEFVDRVDRRLHLLMAEHHARRA